MLHSLIGGTIAIVALIGVSISLRDLYRSAQERNNQLGALLTNQKPAVDYSNISYGLDNVVTGAFEQTCHVESATSEGVSAACESTASLASHALEGLSHVVHH